MILKKAFLSLLFLTLGCTSAPPKSPYKQKSLVLSSIPPYTYFVKRIAKESLKIESLVPLRADPHTFEPSVRKMEEFQNADLFLAIGEPYEQKALESLKHHHPILKVVDLLEKVDLIPLKGNCSSCKSTSLKDRHLWLSPKQAKIQAQTIAKALMEHYPDKKAFFQKNLEEFLKELDFLDHEISLLLQPLKQRAFLVNHPALSYLCRDYGLEQIALEKEGHFEPSIKALGKVFQKLKEKKITKAFLQEQYNNKAIEMLAKNHPLSLYTLDPYSPDLLENIRKIVNTIAKPEGNLKIAL